MVKDVNTRLQLENQRLKVDLANRSPRRLAHLHQLSSFMLRLHWPSLTAACQMASYTAAVHFLMKFLPRGICKPEGTGVLPPPQWLHNN